MLPLRASLFTISAVLAAAAACSPRPAELPVDGGAAATAVGGADGGVQCTPLETRPPLGKGQRPAFAGQTRGCGVKSNVAYDVSVVATGLEKPWSVEPLPGGDYLVTEKPGRLRIVSRTGTIGAPIAGVPAVDARGQGGLLDVALSPAFATDRTIFWSFTEPREGGNGTTIARGTLPSDRKSLDDVRVIFRVLPTYSNNMHFGSRLAFGPDGMLYATFGERSDRATRPYAQRLDSHLGKIVRIRPDGTVPPDNPFVGRDDAKPEIWSVGHRNIQAAAFDPTGQLWSIEHGTNGGDELNRIEKGKNYGWADVGYGVEYSGQPLPGPTAKAGTEQPVYYWDPVIAPSGAQFYTGDAFPAWKNSLFIGALKEQRLVRLTIEHGRVTGEEHLLTDRGHRLRDVKQGPDGALYIVTDDQSGELWRVAPKR
jgi:glucose/arabinose dehydrogenase